MPLILKGFIGQNFVIVFDFRDNFLSLPENTLWEQQINRILLVIFRAISIKSWHGGCNCKIVELIFIHGVSHENYSSIYRFKTK